MKFKPKEIILSKKCFNQLLYPVMDGRYYKELIYEPTGKVVIDENKEKFYEYKLVGEQ